MDKDKTDPRLSSAANLRALESRLEEAIRHASDGLTALKKASATQRKRLERSDQIDSVKQQLAKAEELVRQDASDERITRVLTLKRELREAAPAPEPEEDPEPKEQEHVPFCKIDGRPFEHGRCPVNAEHRAGESPYSRMKDLRQRLVGSQRSFWER